MVSGAEPRTALVIRVRWRSRVIDVWQYASVHAAAPAVEYSIFPYREYATRQLVIQYQLGYEHARYNEITLFGKLRETNGIHALSAELDVRQPWGSLEGGRRILPIPSRPQQVPH